MALQARRFHGKPLLQPNYNFRDVPYCSRDLSMSTLSTVTERQHLVDSIAELTLLCNEGARRAGVRNGGPGAGSSSSSAASSKKPTKPLSIEYIFDRIDTDDPLWGLMVRTDTPASLKGRPSNARASPLWRRGMLQGFIAMTTFTNWQSTFRFDSMHEAAFGGDDDELEEQMRGGTRKYDEDGTLAEELEASVKGGNPHMEGIVYPRIAEVSLLGAMGCGKQLLRLLVEHLECLKASPQHNYDYVVLQATENSIPFYEHMGFARIGCVQGKTRSPDEYCSGPVEEYFTKQHGETPVTVAKEFGVDVCDIVFLNKPVWPKLATKSWLKEGTKIFVPSHGPPSPKWHMSRENETPRGIAKRFKVDFGELLRANKRRYPDLGGNSKLIKGTLIQISRFHMDESDTVAYSHWTFPEAAEEDDNDESYMMAMRLNRKKGPAAKVKPVAFSLEVPIKPYSPEATGVNELLLQPGAPRVPLAPVFKAGGGPRKEPQKPKRPMTSFLHFSAEVRSKHAEKLKGLTVGEISKELSDKWQLMFDDQKIPYEKKFEESKKAYNKAMKKYAVEMDRFRRQSPADPVVSAEGVDVSLLEKVVKLKSRDGISGTSKFEYFYVLTFIPDLQWVHLIPMRKAGSFGPEHPAASGRPIWMIVGEEEGREIDTAAAACQPVAAVTVKNSADADDEQWNIYDNGEEPPPPPRNAPRGRTGAPSRPKKPATPFASFCGDAKSLMEERLLDRPFAERTKIIAARWKAMTEEERRKYTDEHAEAQEMYARKLGEYKEDLAEFHGEDPAVVAPASSAVSSATRKSSRKIKTPPVESGCGEIDSSSSGISSEEPEPAMGIGTPATNASDAEADASASSAISSKMPKSTKKVETTTAKAGDGGVDAAQRPMRVDSAAASAAPDEGGRCGGRPMRRSTRKIKTAPVKSEVDSLSSAISSETPKSTTGIGTPATEASDAEVDASASSVISSKMPKSTKKVETPTAETGDGEVDASSSHAMSSKTSKTAKRTKTPVAKAKARQKKKPLKRRKPKPKPKFPSKSLLFCALARPSPSSLPQKKPAIASLAQAESSKPTEPSGITDRTPPWKQKGALAIASFVKAESSKPTEPNSESKDETSPPTRKRALAIASFFKAKSSKPTEPTPETNDETPPRKRRRALAIAPSVKAESSKPTEPTPEAKDPETNDETPPRKRSRGQAIASSVKAESSKPTEPTPEAKDPETNDETLPRKRRRGRAIASSVKAESSKPMEPTPEAKDETPPPKRKRGRPRKHPLPDTTTTKKAVVHTVKKAAIHPESPSSLEDSVKPKLPLAPIFLKNNGKKKKRNDSSPQSPANSEESKEASTEPPRYLTRKRLTRKRKQALEDSHFVSDDAISETSLEVFGRRKQKARMKC